MASILTGATPSRFSRTAVSILHPPTATPVSRGLPCVPPGTFLTTYDFQGFVGIKGSLPAGWSFSTQLTGITPQQTSPVDSPSITNITFFYTGPIVSGGISGVDSAPFVVISSFGLTVPSLFELQVAVDCCQ
jgi:hypothetical protein